MQLLFAYLLKLSLCLSIGYLFYFVLLRHMTYYNWNRYFLLLFPVAAVLIPLLPVSLPQQLRASNVSFFVADTFPSGQTGGNAAEAAPVITAINWIAIVAWVMIAGMIFFLLRFAIRLYSLYRARTAGRLMHNGDIKLYHIEGCTAPFSFYNSIYLDTRHYDETELEKIITHEAVHISQRHTMDTMLAEALCIIQWFNPFAWLLKTAIRQNLEFIADDAVLQRGASRTNYQYLLLKVSGAHVPHALATNLLFPSLKKRIQMMNRERTKRFHLWKFICLVPVGCLLLVAFSGPAKMNHTSDADDFNLSKLVIYTNDMNVSMIVKNNQDNSFLQTGKPLSLASIKKEKSRLKNLLAENGYSDIDNQAISFVMDSLTSKNFSVAVLIKIDKPHKYTPGNTKTQSDTSLTYHPKRDPGDVTYIVASGLSVDPRLKTVAADSEPSPNSSRKQ